MRCETIPCRKLQGFIDDAAPSSDLSINCGSAIKPLVHPSIEFKNVLGFKVQIPVDITSALLTLQERKKAEYASGYRTDGKSGAPIQERCNIAVDVLPYHQE